MKHNGRTVSCLFNFVCLEFGKDIFAFWGWSKPIFWWNVSNNWAKFSLSIFVTQSLTFSSLLVYSVVRPFFKKSHKRSPVIEEEFEPIIYR